MAFFVGLTILINGVIFSFGWDISSDKAALCRPYVEPSGELIAIVWIILISLLSIARWHLNQFNQSIIKTTKSWLSTLIILCITYPFYSIAINGIAGIFIGLIGNTVIIAIAIYNISLLTKISNLALSLTLPTLIWVLFATTIIMSELCLF
jgi:tryptophan-rich sensory protein